MVGFVLKDLKDEQLQTDLYNDVWAAQYGITQSSHHLFSMLEHYNPETCTFFTLVGEIGFALHEMYEVFRLAIGDIVYKRICSIGQRTAFDGEKCPFSVCDILGNVVSLPHLR